MFRKRSHGKGRNADTEGGGEREDNFLVIKMGRSVGEEREEENASLESSTHVGG